MKMKTMVKLLCSAAMVCGAFFMSALNVYAANETKAPEATTVVSTEKVTLSTEKPTSAPTTDTTDTTTLTAPEVTEDTTETIVEDESGEEVSDETALPLGNGVLLEDKHDDVVDRQFLTIQSKNGNTFYIIVDKDSKGKENVYFMNLVDEYDLLAFAEDFPEGVAEKPDKNNEAVVTDTNGDPVSEVSTDTNGKPIEDNGDKTAEGGNNNTLLIILGVLALGGGGALYYFKFVKGKPKAPKQPDYPDEDDDEYTEETVNEDIDE